MILASILILPDGERPVDLPPEVADNVASLRWLHPGLEHRLFTGAMIRDFLRDRFGREVLSAYDALKPFAFKADLARHCIMHEHGGIYADLSMRFVNPLLPEPRLRVFRDFLGAAPWDTVTGVFAAPPRHKALAKAIEMICANVARRYVGPNSRCPTGPTLFGRAVALSCSEEDISPGNSMWLDPARAGLPQAGSGRRHCMVFAGKVICVKQRQPRESFRQLGFADGNDYDAMWRAGDIYER